MFSKLRNARAIWASITILGCIAMSTPAEAQDGQKGKRIDLREIVRVVGTPRPEFTVELSPDDLRKLADSVGQLTDLAPKEVDINDLYNPGDERAIADASQALAQAILDSTAEMVNLKAVIYRLAALSSLPDFQDDRGALYQAYQTKIQASYTRAMSLLLEMSDQVSNAIQECNSELCAVTIGNAQIELMRFGDGLNQDLDLDRLSSFHFAFQFQNKLLRGVTAAALANLWDALAPENRPENPVAYLIAGALTPVVAAGGAVIDIGHAFADLIAAPTATRFGIRARRVNESASDQAGIVHELVARKIFSIVNHMPMGDVKRIPRKRHLIVLKCGGDRGQFLVVGGAKLACVVHDRGVSFNYVANIFGVGPGFSFVANEDDGNGSKNFRIIIVSLVKVDPEGTWYGADVSGGVLLAGEFGVFLGKSGSIAVVGGLGMGGGAELSGAQLRISRSDRSQ